MHTNQKQVMISDVFFQAHRGTIDEGKENTLPAFLHAWQFPQAIVETDVRQLVDGTLICLHDRTIRRVCSTFTPLLDTPVESLTWEELQHIDLGKGYRIPLFESVLELMVQNPNWQLYLEIKEAELARVLTIITAYDVVNRILFVHESQEFLQHIHTLLPANQKMTWCSGSTQQIIQRFEALKESHFAGLTQVQIHYPVYETATLPEDFLDYALACTKRAGVILQVCPTSINGDILSFLLKKGVRWFVSNAPLAFVTLLEQVLLS